MIHNIKMSEDSAATFLQALKKERMFDGFCDEVYSVLEDIGTQLMVQSADSLIFALGAMDELISEGCLEIFGSGMPLPITEKGKLRYQLLKQNLFCPIRSIVVRTIFEETDCADTDIQDIANLVMEKSQGEKKPEKESCTIKDVEGLNGKQFKQVTFIISAERILEMESSLANQPLVLGIDRILLSRLDLIFAKEF